MIRYQPTPSLFAAWRSLRAPTTPESSVRAALGVNASSALELAPSATELLRRCLARLAPEGEVLVPAFTCVNVAWAVNAAGHVPRFVDVDEETGVVTPAAILAAAGPTTRAAIASHFFGCLADMTGIADAVGGRFPVFEDSALALRLGSSTPRGIAGTVLSFGRGKPLSLGTGGLLLTRIAESADVRDEAVGKTLGAPGLALASAKNGALALRAGRMGARLLNLRPMESAGEAYAPWPVRLSPAAERMLAWQLAHAPIEEAMAVCGRITRSYVDAIAAHARFRGRLLPGTSGTAVTSLLTPALPVRVFRRDDCLAALRRAGLDLPAYWRYSLATQWGDAGCPASERLARELLYLPIHAAVRPDDIGRALDIISRCGRG